MPPLSLHYEVDIQQSKFLSSQHNLWKYLLDPSYFGLCEFHFPSNGGRQFITAK